jgi:hypothetical protein
MRRFQIFCVTLLCGCASAATSTGDLLTQPRIRTVLAGSITGDNPGGATQTLRYVEDPIIIRETVPGSVPVTWDLLIQAYADDGLIPDQMDEASHTLSVSSFDLRRDWNGVPVTVYLDCGLSSTGRPLAEDAQIRGTIISRVGEVGTGSAQISLRFEAVAFPSDASSARAQDCYTTGELEQALVGRINNALGGADPGSPVLMSPGPTPSPTAGNTATPVHSTAAFPVEPGKRVRVYTSATERYTGTFLTFRNDTLLLRRTRVTNLPLSAVRVLEVQQTQTSVIVTGAVLGAGAGIAIAVGTELGITGDHQAQGKILNPGLGMVVGGLAGAFIASKLFGTTWVEVPLELRPVQGSGNTGIGVGLRAPWPRRR